MSDFYGFRRRRWDRPDVEASLAAAARLRRREALLNSNWLLLAVLVVSVIICYLLLSGTIRIDLSATSGRIESTRLIK